MNLIHQNIQLITLILLIMGWWIHNWALLGRLTRIKGRLISLKWYMDNRPYKFRTSVLSAFVGALVAYVWFDPSALDIMQKEGKRDLAIYLATIFGIGAGADFITDQIGTKTSHKHEEEPDDGKTIRRN